MINAILIGMVAGVVGASSGIATYELYQRIKMRRQAKEMKRIGKECAKIIKDILGDKHE